MGAEINISGNKMYDLIPSQNAMYLMYKFGLHKQQAQIPTSIFIKDELDLNILQRAFSIEISRNDCLRLKFITKNGKVKQYFSDTYSYKVPVKYFFSDKQQDDYLSQDAKRKVSFMKGEIFRIIFFKTAYGGTGIYTNFSHLVADAMGIMNFYFDLLKVYEALVNKTPLPAPVYSYEEYVKNELERSGDTKKTEKHENFYREYFLKGGEPFYAAVHGPEFLEKFRKKTKDPSARVPFAYNPLYDKCDMMVLNISKEDTDKIYSYCERRRISPESVFQLGLRTYCSSVNYRIDDVCMMSVCSRRINYKTKNMSGCMAQPLILRTIIAEDASFSSAVEEMANIRTTLYRHADYPYTKARDMFLELFDFGPIQGANSLMFSWIPLPTESDFSFDIDFKTYNLGRYFTPLYTIVTPDSETKGIKVYYMYRTKLITGSQIKRLHNNAVNVMLKGISDPDITIGELLDSVE